MNKVSEDIMSYYGCGSEEEELFHYGTKFHSGRYPWGSGKEPYQNSGDFLSRVETLRNSGYTHIDKETGKKYTRDMAIAKYFGLSSTEFRVQVGLAKEERRMNDVARAKSLKADGLNPTEIGRKMGKNESSVRDLLKYDEQIKEGSAKYVANFLKDKVDNVGFIDVGKGVERELNVSKEKMDQALYMLYRDGYEIYPRGISQVTNKGRQINTNILCPPGTEHKEVYDDSKIHSVEDYYSNDGGKTFNEWKFQYPRSLDSKRLKILLADEKGPDGVPGIERDGLIQIRPGCKDLDLQGDHYRQVRIMVDNEKYLKGMAVYSDNMPDGIDVIFNTNKSSYDKALKKIKPDPDNPFGSAIKKNGQSTFIDDDGKEKLSLINRVRDEGDWGEWSKELPAQFLSKQSQALIDKQLNLTMSNKKEEYDEICNLTNPTIKKKLLEKFADDCDAAAVHLKAAALPRQKYQVIIPIPQLKENEVYAPNFENGEKLALVRFPHGGTFEIPKVTVNNKQPDAEKILAGSVDAIGINAKVAARLSGADFDGDTVMCIPTAGNGRNLKVNITSTKALEGLEGFDPTMSYGGKKPGTFKVMSNTQNEMGRISNLITDMTLKGATPNELARAVRHSMVVIDAEKHELDYKQSEKDNGIAELRKIYQGHYDSEGKYHESASTLISKAKSPTDVLKRKGSAIVDKETGKKSFKEVVETYETVKVKNSDGKWVKPTDAQMKQYREDKASGKNLDGYKVETNVRTQKSTKMAETDDAFTLSSGTAQEKAYATYANYMKSLANQSRKEMISTPNLKYSKTAKEIYKTEVESLDSKLRIASKNAPRERLAQAMANSVLKAKKQSNPSMTPEEEKKESQRALEEARSKVGAKRQPIVVNDREWEAIQAGAISDNKLTQILNYADTTELRKRATPRTSANLNAAKIANIKSMSAAGYTLDQIAKRYNVSTATISKAIRGKE